MAKIKQILPVPQGRNYYAVYRDNSAKSGYIAERVDYLMLVKSDNNEYSIEGMSGYVEIVSEGIYNYFGTFREDALKVELPELWEEIKTSSVYQDELSAREQLAEHRGKLNLMSKQIAMLEQKFAELKKENPHIAQGNSPDTEKAFGAKSYDCTPSDNVKTAAQVSCENARQIKLRSLYCCGKATLDYRTIDALDGAGMKLLGDVADKTFDELIQIKYIGRSAMNKIFTVLRAYGLTLKDEVSVYLKPIAVMKSAGTSVPEISRELNIPQILVVKYLKFIHPDLKFLG